MPRSPRSATPPSPARNTRSPPGSVVRRIRADPPPGQDELLPAWRYHAFITDTRPSTVDADATHRAHAVIEQVFADLIDGPLAHLAVRRECRPVDLRGMVHNLLRAAACLTSRAHARPRTPCGGGSFTSPPRSCATPTACVRTCPGNDPGRAGGCACSRRPTAHRYPPDRRPAPRAPPEGAAAHTLADPRRSRTRRTTVTGRTNLS